MTHSATQPAPEPALFSPSPHLDDLINHNAIQSEIEGGVFLRDLPVGGRLEVRTQNRCYHLQNLGSGEVVISGHEKFCPEPVAVRVTGSTWGGSMLKRHFVGRQMRLEFVHPKFGVIWTSYIEDIRQLQTAR